MTDIEIHGQMVFLETMSELKLAGVKKHYENGLKVIQDEIQNRMKTRLFSGGK